MEKEYNGEKIIAKYMAKIVTSNRDPFDFVSNPSVRARKTTKTLR